MDNRPAEHTFSECTLCRTGRAKPANLHGVTVSAVGAAAGQLLLSASERTRPLTAFYSAAGG